MDHGQLNTEWLNLQNAVIALIGLILIFYEYFRPQIGWRKLLRMIAAFFMIIALIYLLAVPTKFKSNGKTAIVVTKGYDPELLERLKTEDSQVYRNDLNSFELPDQSEYDSIILIGDGLPDTSFLTPGAIKWIAGDPPEGIYHIDEPEYVWLNQLSTYQVYIDNKLYKHLIINDIYNNYDTIQIERNPVQFFWKYRVPGEQSITLKACDSSFSVIEENVTGAYVRPFSQLNFLFISSYPSAEFRALKDHLYRDGHTVTVRNQVGRNKFKYEFLNRPPNRDIFNSLDEYDLIISDSRSISQLSRNERAQILEAVKNGGGLFVYLSELPNSLSGFELPSFNKTTQTVIGFNGATIGTYPFRFSRVTEGITIPEVNVIRKEGRGRIMFSLMESTYPILFKGDSVTYRELWSELIFESARMKNNPGFEYPPIYSRKVNSLMQISFYSEFEPGIFINNVSLPVSRDIIVPEKWIADFWPKQPGWHTISAVSETDSLSESFFVPESSQWNIAQSMNTRALNKDFLLQQEEKMELVKETQPPITDNQLWWLCLFLFGFSILWIEPRV